jgi:hypothetical protein
MAEPTNLRERMKSGVINSLPIVGAFAFVVMTGLLVILATAEKKNEPINALVTTLGVGVQSFIAFMVYRLSMRQFEFARTMSRRQERISAYPVRNEALQEFKAWWHAAHAAPSEEAAIELMGLIQTLDNRFDSKSVSDLTSEFSMRFVEYAEETENLRMATAEGASDTELFSYRLKVAGARNDVLVTHGILLFELRREMSIELGEY